MTIVAVATQAAGRYCEESMSPAFAHVWVCLFLLYFGEYDSSLTAFSGCLDNHHRVNQRLNSHVLFDPVLLPDPQRH